MIFGLTVIDCSTPYTRRTVVVWPCGFTYPVIVVFGVLSPPVGRIVSTVARRPSTTGVVNEMTLDSTEATLFPATIL
jgi:hypothetical protein